MSRKNFAEILSESGAEIEKEYERLIHMYYIDPSYGGTLDDYVEKQFNECPFKGTCISLGDFDDTHGFSFPRQISSKDIDTLILFCEYSCNMLSFGTDNPSSRNKKQRYYQQVHRVMDLICYDKFRKDGLILFAPKSQAVSIAAQSVSVPISYKVIEYNHHSLRGDIEAKKTILKMFADQLEARRDDLSSANRSLCADLFMLFNNLNIRHNNVDRNSPSYKRVVAEMSKDDLEEWYDNTYMLCMEAFVTLDNGHIKDAIKNLKQDL